MNKGYFRTLRIFILFFCMSLGLMAESQTAKADLMLDDWQIDGSCSIFFDQQPLREIQYNGEMVWRAGADITYSIDAGIYETHFVPYGQTTLSVTGSKEGYEFVGWREDTTASGDVLEADLCTGDEKILYAVFQKTVTVTYYNGSSIPQTSVGYLYYNNGNISYPEFTIAQAELNGWISRGWATGKAADAAVLYQELDHTVLTANMILYGMYQKSVTVSFDGNDAEGGNTDALTGTAYYNSAGNTANPSFRMPENGFTKSGHVWSGWMQGSTGTIRSAGENITLAADTTFSAVWKLEKVRITFVEAGVSTTVEYEKGTSVNRNSIAPSGTTFVGWSASASGGDPSKTFVATQDITYYRVIKLSDYTVVSHDAYGNHEQMSGPFYISSSDYPTLTITGTSYSASGGIKVIYKDDFWETAEGGWYVPSSSVFGIAYSYADSGTVTTIVPTQSPFWVHSENEDGEIYGTVVANGVQKVG